MAITRRRAVGVEVKWMCAILVRALRTWSSMAPWQISPPSMWAMGMRRARATDGGRKHLVAVGDQQQQVGTPCGERIGQAENGDADGLGHAGVGVGAEQALDARLNRKSVALDFANGRAELRREMRAQREDAQVDIGMRGQLAQRPVEVAIVGARGGHHADAPPPVAVSLISRPVGRICCARASTESAWRVIGNQRAQMVESTARSRACRAARRLARRLANCASVG